MFVRIRWGRRSLAIPLIQLELCRADPETKQAVQDWHCWVGQDYVF